jgi:hypothetical protein
MTPNASSGLTATSRSWQVIEGSSIRGLSGQIRVRIRGVAKIAVAALCAFHPQIGHADDGSGHFRKELWVNSFSRRLLDDPGRLAYIYEAYFHPDTARQQEAGDKLSMQVPPMLLTEAGLGLGWDIWKVLGANTTREQQIADIKSIFNRQPDEFYEFSSEAYDSLMSPVNSRDQKFKSYMEDEFAKGGLLAPDVSDRALLNDAPNSQVTLQAINQLKTLDDTALQQVMSDDAQLRGYLNARLGTTETLIQSSTDAVQSEVSQIKSLTESIVAAQADAQQRQASFERQQAAIGEERASVYIAASFISIFNPGVGKYVGTIGNSLITVGGAIGSIAENGLSAAATGNIVGAILSITGLFGSHEDPVRQALQDISAQLNDIKSHLHLIDQKLDRLAALIQQAAVQSQQSLDQIQLEVEQVGREVQAGFAALRVDNQTILQSPFYQAYVDCKNKYSSRNEYIVDPTSSPGQQIGTCLSLAEDYALRLSESAAFTQSGANPTDGIHVHGNDGWSYVGTIGALVRYIDEQHGHILTGADSVDPPGVEEIASLDGLPNPDVWYAGVKAWLELRELVPELDWPKSNEIVSNMIDTGNKLANAIHLVWSFPWRPIAPGTVAFYGLSYESALDDAYEDFSAWARQFASEQDVWPQVQNDLGHRLLTGDNSIEAPTATGLSWTSVYFNIFNSEVTQFFSDEQSGFSTYKGGVSTWKGCFNLTDSLKYGPHGAAPSQVVLYYQIQRDCRPYPLQSNGRLDNIAHTDALIPDMIDLDQRTAAQLVSYKALMAQLAPNLVGSNPVAMNVNQGWAAIAQTQQAQVSSFLEGLRVKLYGRVQDNVATNAAYYAKFQLIDRALEGYEELTRFVSGECFWSHSEINGLFYGDARLISGSDIESWLSSGSPLNVAQPNAPVKAETGQAESLSAALMGYIEQVPRDPSKPNVAMGDRDELRWNPSEYDEQCLQIPESLRRGLAMLIAYQALQSRSITPASISPRPPSGVDPVH